MPYLFPKAITFILLFFAFLSNTIAQSPSFYRDSGSKYVEIKKHTTSNDFYGTAQLKVGSYLTLGNFGYSNQSWIGNNALLDIGGLGNRNMFIPVYSDGTALVLKPDFNTGSFSGFIHQWNGNASAVDFENFEEVWKLSKDNSFIKSSVGIGKAPAPNIQLDVNGIVHAREYISVQNGSAYRVALNGQSDGYIVARNENNENTLRLSSDGNSFFKGGKLGIGTNSPNSALEVAGHSDALFTALKLRNTNGLGSIRSSVGIDFHHFNTPIDPNARIYEVEGPTTGTYGGNLVFATRTSGGSLASTTLEDRLMIAHDGSVGIGTGTTAPQAKLHVNGNILAAEVTVSTAATEVPDYVFKEGYKLTSLKDLEKYIEENHHLPEVPSAKEVEAEGLDLAKMNLLLLKKIEELTLHTIEQEKKFDKQFEKIDHQDEMIKGYERKFIEQKEQLNKQGKRIDKIEKLLTNEN